MLEKVSLTSLKSITMMGLRTYTCKNYGKAFKFAPVYPDPGPNNPPSQLELLKHMMQGQLPQFMQRASISNISHRFEPRQSTVFIKKNRNYNGIERNDDNDEDNIHPPNYMASAMLNFKVPILRHVGKDGQAFAGTASDDETNMANWEKKIEATRIWEEEEKKKQKQQQLQSADHGFRRRWHHQAKHQHHHLQQLRDHSTSKKDERYLYPQETQAKAVRQLTPKSESKLRRKTEEFAFHEQGRGVNMYDKLQNLMEQQNVNLDELLDDQPKPVGLRVLPSDLGKYQFENASPHSPRRCELRRAASCHWRPEFDYPDYTPTNANSDNADVLAQRQRTEHNRPNFHESSVIAIHRARAAELDNLKAQEGSVKESAVNRIFHERKLMQYGARRNRSF